MIVACGEALIDMIQNQDGSRRAVPGGGPFNTARALARLGVPTAFLGHLSNDSFGRELGCLLQADGVGMQYVTVGPEKTTIAIADINSEGVAEYRFLVEGTSAPNLTREMIPPDFDDDVTAIHVGTLGLVFEPMADALVGLAKREGSRRVLMLDPNVRTALSSDLEYRDRLQCVIEQSTVVKASDTDLAWLYPDHDFEEAAKRILDRGVALVIVTLGADGAFGAYRDLRVRVEAPRVDVVDTIGAGDAFGAALLAWLHNHGSLRTDLVLDDAELKAALDYSCLAAAINCTCAGADPPRRREMISA